MNTLWKKGNNLGHKGAEFLSKFLSNSNSGDIEYLNISSTNLDVDGSKLLGIAFSNV